MGLKCKCPMSQRNALLCVLIYHNPMIDIAALSRCKTMCTGVLQPLLQVYIPFLCQGWCACWARSGLCGFT